MEISVAKNILSYYRNAMDEYLIPMNMVSESISEAIMGLCDGSTGYVLTGYFSKGERYYLVYKPDTKRIRVLSQNSVAYFEGLCTRMNGYIFNKCETGFLANLDIKSYDQNINNCRQTLDDILIRNYKDKLSYKVDFLMVIAFSKNQFHYFCVE